MKFTNKLESHDSEIEILSKLNYSLLTHLKILSLPLVILRDICVDLQEKYTFSVFFLYNKCFKYLQIDTYFIAEEDIVEFTNLNNSSSKPIYSKIYLATIQLNDNKD